MNIFLIPSWYPTKESPVTGRFFKEQALLYANEYRQDNLVISRWGQGEFIVDLTKPVTGIKKLYRYIKAKNFEKTLAENITEFYTPAIEIRPRKYAGDISSIISANIDNFKKAQQKYGHIDIVHAHVSFPAGFIAAKIADLFDVPYVLTEHMGPFPFPFYLNGDRLSAKLQTAFEKAEQVVAVSSFLQKELSKYSIVTHAVIPDFIDDDYFVPQKSGPHKGFIFFALGRITIEKGIDTLLYAFAEVYKDKPGLYLKIAGSGPDIQEMMNLCTHLDIDSRVEWLGELDVSDVKAYLQACDVLICASTYETFGVAVSEALCCGKPVISTACGGPEDMVNDVNGILVSIGDVSAMANAMYKMREEIQNFKANQIRSEHVEKFGKKTLTAQLRRVYLDTLENR